MAIIALTGGIGSGKSEVSRLFAALGAPIVDTDVIAHQLTAPNQAAIDPIIAQFGADFINETGALDRPKMREHVFNHPEARLMLEGILHPLIHAQVLAEISTNKANISQDSATQYQIIVVPLLFESKNYEALTDFTLVVDCDPALQITRTMARSNISEETVRAIIKAQTPQATRLTLADEVIVNNTDRQALKTQVNTLHFRFNQLCFKLTK
jgi:dephospho-CoA kinase